MNIDFALLLVILTVLSGAIWAFDAWVIAPRRRQAVRATQGSAEDRTVESSVREPVIVDYARSFFPIFLLVLLLRSFLIEPFRIPSGSMMPTLLVGDFILVNKYRYGLRLPVLNTKFWELGSPRRGDIIVFRYPQDPSVPFIKRVVGLPGERVAYRNKRLYVNGKIMEQEAAGAYVGVGTGAEQTGDAVRVEHLPGCSHRILINPDAPAVDGEEVVPEGHYFVMGDNRDNSRDSRYWGFVPDENLIGRAFMIWMNFDLKNDNSFIDWQRLGQSIH
ncbi:MAG: signal peptidase I [Chromatiales bacterium]